MADTKPVVSAFAARQQAKLAQATGQAEVEVSAVAQGAAKRSVSDELLKGPSFVEAGKLSRLFRSGVPEKSSSPVADDGFDDDSPYDCDPEEEEARLRYIPSFPCMAPVAYNQCSKRSRVESAPKVVQFTTVKASKDSIIREEGRTIRVKLSPGDVSCSLTNYLAMLT